MELDTGEAGEAVTIMPEKQFQELFGGGGPGDTIKMFPHPLQDILRRETICGGRVCSKSAT